MTDRIVMNQLYPSRIPPVITSKTNQSNAEMKRTNESGKSFQQVFNEKLIRFSHHAEQRLKQRGISFNPDQLVKLENAIDKVAQKGARDSLIILQDVALIVNVKDKTVVTALDGNSMKDNVFTQIDSAVVVS